MAEDNFDHSTDGSGNDVVSRRRVLQSSLVGAGGLLAGCSGIGGDGGGGDSYPSQNIRVIVPSSEGGGLDSYNRAIWPAMGEDLGTNIEYENIAGAGAMRGVQTAVSAEADGYTVTTFSLPLAALSYLVNQPLDFSLTEDLRAIGMITNGVRIMLAADPELGVSSVQDLVDAYANDEIDNIGSAGQGGIETAICMNLGEDPYNFEYDDIVEYAGSGPMSQALAAGEIPVGVSTDAGIAGVSGNEIDAVTSLHSTPTSTIPDDQIVGEPTIEDAGFPPFEILGIFRVGLYAPSGVSDDKISTLADALEFAVTESSSVQEWSEETGRPVGPFKGPDELDELLANSVQTVDEEVDLEQLQNQG